MFKWWQVVKLLTLGPPSHNPKVGHIERLIMPVIANKRRPTRTGAPMIWQLRESHFGSTLKLHLAGVKLLKYLRLVTTYKWSPKWGMHIQTLASLEELLCSTLMRSMSEYRNRQVLGPRRWECCRQVVSQYNQYIEKVMLVLSEW